MPDDLGGGPRAVAAGPDKFRPLQDEVRALECTRITEALLATGGIQRRAAELLGMSYETFRDKLQRYGLRKEK